jgi:hypothetical protein
MPSTEKKKRLPSWQPGRGVKLADGQTWYVRTPLATLSVPVVEGWPTTVRWDFFGLSPSLTAMHIGEYINACADLQIAKNKGDRNAESAALGRLIGNALGFQYKLTRDEIRGLLAPAGRNRSRRFERIMRDLEIELVDVPFAGLAELTNGLKKLETVAVKDSLSKTKRARLAS